MLPSETTIHNRYRIIYVIDERPGSTVYRGRDDQSGRLVLVAALANADPTRNDTMQLARQVAAMSHEAILPVLDHFAEGDRYYIVCEDVGGQDLERTLRTRGGPLPEEPTTEQARRLLDALTALHTQKIALFLGDPLPTDVWIGEDGIWRLTPFTLIRPITHTPSPYRAPELDLPHAEPDASSDLYALSALLYHGLTGWPPPTSAQREAGTPLNGPRALNPALSTLIEQVLLRGLQVKPENRYQAAREMRLSLEMVKMMDGRSVGIAAPPASQPASPSPLVVPPPSTPAQPAAPQPYPQGIYPAPAQPAAPQPYPPAGYPAQPYPPGTYQAPARKRGFSTGCLVVLAILLTLAAVAICAALAWFIPGSPLPALLGVRANVAPTPLAAAPTSGAAPAGVATSPAATLAPASSSPRAITLSSAGQITQTREITNVLLGPVAYAPDGQTLALGISDVISLRDASSLEDFNPPHVLQGHSGQVFVLAWSPDSKLLASGAINDNVVRLWSSSDGKLLRQFAGHRGWIRSVAFSPDGKLLASGSIDQTIRLWDVASGNLVQTLTGHTDFISTAIFSRDGKTIASSSSDGSVRLWDVASGEQRSGFKFEPKIDLSTGQPLWVTGLAFSGDGSLLAAGLGDGSVSLLDATTGAERRKLTGHSSIVVSRGIQFSPDGKLLATASFDGTVRLWDVASGTSVAELRGHGWRVLSLSFSPDGQRLASTSDQGGQLLIWNVHQPDTNPQGLHEGLGVITSLMFSSDSSLLGMVGYNGTARLQLIQQERFRFLLGASAANKSLAFLPDGRFVLIADTGKATLLSPNQAEGTALGGLDGVAFNVVTSGDGRLIVAGGSTGTLGLWDGANGTAKPAIKTGLRLIYGLAVSTDGALIAASGPSDQPQIQLWDSASGKLRQTLTGMTAPVANIAFQPRGSLLAAANAEGTLWLWNTQDGKLVNKLAATPGQAFFSALAFSPDGSLLATGSPNGDILFWNAQTGERVAILPTFGAGNGVYALAFSPDGAQLAIGLADQTVRIFALGSA